MTVNDILLDIDKLELEMYNNNYTNGAQISYQIMEMLSLAFKKKNETNPNTMVMENKETFIKECGDNPYLILFSKLTREVFEKMMMLDDDDFSETFEKVCYKYNAYFRGLSCASPVINELAVGILKKRDGNKVLDLCAGYGLFLNKLGKEKNNLYLHGYEVEGAKAHFANEYIKMSRLSGNVEAKDVLASEMSEKHDIVFAEFPFSGKYNNTKFFASESLKPEVNRKASSDWSFIYKALNSMSNDGVFLTVVPNGTLFRIPEECYRKSIIDKGLLEGVINLPVGSIAGSGVSASLLIFSSNNKYVTFVEASDKYQATSKREKEISVNEILKLWESRHNTCPPKEVKVVSVEDIKSSDYYLEVNRYISKEEKIKLKNSRPLKDYAELVPGFQYTTRNYVEMEHGEGNVHVVKISNIIDNEINYESTASIEVDTKKIERFILRNKDILVATKGTAVKAAMFEEKGDETYIAQSNVTVIRVIDYSVSPDYLLAYINGKTGRKLLESLQKGIAISSISMKDLEGYEVPVVDEVLQYDLGSKYRGLKEEKKKLLERIASIDEEISSVCEDYIKE